MGESENKIEELERRISYLEQEVALLKNPSKSITSNRSFSLDGYEKYMTPEKPEATSDVHVELQPQIQPLTQPQEEPVNNQAKYIRPESRKKDMEAFIGKHGMAVGASLLIFIAMVMFATLLIPKLSVELKCAALFIFSGAFIVVGLIHEKKNGINKWNTAIIGCGTGAVFISIYVLYSYILEVRFPSGGIIVLFVLLIAWASALCFLSNKKSMIYAVIAQIGILISAIFGNIQLSGDLSVVLPIVMILISEAPFMITDLFRKNYWNYFVTWMGASLSTFVVTVDDGILMDYIGWGCLFYIVAAALIIYTYFAGAAFAKTKKEVTAAIITGCLTVCPFIMFLCMDIKDSLDAEWSCLISLILVAVAGAMGLFIDRLCIKNDYHGPIKSAVHSILLVVIFGYLGMAIDARIDAYTVIISLMLPVIAIATSIYADRASNVVYKYYALVMLALSVLIDNDYTVLKSIIAFGMIIYIAYSM
nr:hypothetical protein [Pseudobutyrivibrio sp.]